MLIKVVQVIAIIFIYDIKFAKVHYNINHQKFTDVKEE
jgi:hypothetical protein